MSARREHSLQNVFVLALFAVFAAAIILTLMFGARVYRSMESEDSAAYNGDVAVAYIAQRLRHSADTVGFAVGTFGGSDALYIYEQTYGVDYQTAIYVYDGWLCELYTEKGLDLSPDAGTQLLECESVSFSQPDAGRLRLDVTAADGKKSSLTIALRDGRWLAV